jgi:hypothetical protein
MSTSATRRALCRSMILGGAAAVATGTATARPVNYGPDDELIRLCLQFDALEAKKPSGDPVLWEAMPEDEFWRIEDELSDQQDALFERIEALNATTVEGLRVRTRTMLQFSPDILDDFRSGAADGFMDSRMVMALFRDLLGEVSA